MAKNMKSFSELEGLINQRIKLITDEVANVLCDKLKQHINEDYYKEYYPIVYERTWQFLNSVTRTDIATDKNKISVAIYLDTNNMTYAEITPEEVINLASYAMHGKPSIIAGLPFWEEFRKECSNEYILSLYKKKLTLLGFTVK